MKPLTFAETRNNRRKNTASTWFAPGTDRADATGPFAFQRLNADLFLPRCEPRFSLPAGGAYFMIGSCFARGLESVLAGNGYNVISLSSEFNRFESAGIGTQLGSTNRYNTAAILNEVTWALDPARPFPENAILDIGDGLTFDPHMNPTLRPAGRDETLERRQILTGVMRQIASADVIFITLGSVETWFDTQIGLATNVVPDPRAIRQDPDRFLFQRLTCSQNLANLEAIHALLQQYGKPGHKVVLAVLPEPLMTTFTSEDVVVANTYSKATLRSAATEFTELHPNVDYLPSYEIVMNSNESMAWVEDKRHIQGPFAAEIARFFIRTWIGENEPIQLPQIELGAAY